MFYWHGSGWIKWIDAGIAQLAERKLPKLEVASSTLVARSIDGCEVFRSLPLQSSGEVIPGVHRVQTGD